MPTFEEEKRHKINKYRWRDVKPIESRRVYGILNVNQFMITTTCGHLDPHTHTFQTQSDKNRFSNKTNLLLIDEDDT